MHSPWFILCYTWKNVQSAPYRLYGSNHLQEGMLNTSYSNLWFFCNEEQFCFSCFVVTLRRKVFTCFEVR